MFSTISGLESGLDASEKSIAVIFCIYRQIIYTQISSRSVKKQWATWVIKIKVFKKHFSKQNCFIICRKQQLKINKQRKNSKFTFAKESMSNLPKITRQKSARWWTHLRWLLACMDLNVYSVDSLCF